MHLWRFARKGAAIPPSPPPLLTAPLNVQLLRAEEEGGFVGRMGSQTGLKSKKSRDSALTPGERRNLTVYVAQVTRLKMRLDWRLEQLLQKSTVAQLQPTLRQILRLGAEFPHNLCWFDHFHAALPRPDPQARCRPSSQLHLFQYPHL